MRKHSDQEWEIGNIDFDLKTIYIRIGKKIRKNE